MKTRKVSPQTTNNWLLDMSLLTSGVVAAISGVYFLILPSGGYQGGRNPYYQTQILFERHTWEDLHIWGGIAMILVAFIHIVFHWKWIKAMVRRTWSELSGKCACFNPHGRWNLVLNLVVGSSFVITALSGIYLLFVPGGRGAVDPGILFSRTTWDLIHTWAGVLFIDAAVIHFVIHWRWVTNVTKKIFSSVAVRRLSAPSTTPENI
ncbi:MAG: DUF4405 domain-containing protein [Chloroflexota bacterium]